KSYLLSFLLELVQHTSYQIYFLCNYFELVDSLQSSFRSFCSLIYANFLSFAHLFTSYSRRMASCFVAKYSVLFKIKGPRPRVYFAPFPCSCMAIRFLKSFV